MTIKMLAFASLLAATTLTLPGCYKAEATKEKARADAAEQKAKGLEGDLAKVRADLQAALTKAQAAETQLTTVRSGSALVTLVNGQVGSRDSVRWDGQQFVRHGDCARMGGIVKFDSGRLADQMLLMNQPSGKPWFAGTVRNSRPVDEWIFFDSEGKPQHREIWKDGHLAEVGRAVAGKTGQWGKLGKADRDAWIKSSAGVFAALPELVRDTSPPPPPPAPPAPPKPDPKAKTPAKSGTKK